jgi:hypothetical protein
MNYKAANVSTMDGKETTGTDIPNPHNGPPGVLSGISSNNSNNKNKNLNCNVTSEYDSKSNNKTINNNNNINIEEGFKWSLGYFKKWLAEREGKAVMVETFCKIHDLLVKTMIAAESEITPQLHNHANYRTNCYELFGCDVILDRKLNPSLLEVNVSPSLMGSSPLDKRIKGLVMADVFHTVGMYSLLYI